MIWQRLVGAKEIGHQGRVLATKLADLNLICGVNMVEGENRLPQFVL